MKPAADLLPEDIESAKIYEEAYNAERQMREGLHILRRKYL